MEFESLLPFHQSHIDKFISKCDTLQSDFSVATLLLWTDFTNPKIYITDYAVYICGYVNDEFIFISPLCEYSYFPTAVENMRKECIKRGELLKIIYGTEKQVDALLKADGSEFLLEDVDLIKQPRFLTEDHCFVYERTMAEYVYLPQTLIDLQGQKLQNKKHRLAKFRKEYEGRYVVRPMTNDDVVGIEEMTINWNKLKHYDYHEELDRLLYLIHHREELSMQIHLLIIDGKVVGMTIFQILVNGVGVVLFEKCDSEHIDGFSELNHYEAEQMKDCKIINRQEDLGLEGLRLSKMTYQPVTLVSKFTITENLQSEIKELYQSVFGDSDELTSLILDNSTVPYSALDADKDRVVACGFVRMKQLRSFNTILQIPYLFGIATDPAYRRQGRAAKVVRKLLYALYNEKCPLAMLCPATTELYNYYYGMGFVRFNFERLVPLSAIWRENMNLRIGSSDDYASVSLMFNEYNKRFTISQYRSDFDTLRRLKEVESDGGKLVWLSTETGDFGYLLIDETGETVEAVFEPNQNVSDKESAESQIREMFCKAGFDEIRFAKGIKIPISRPLSQIEADNKETFENEMLRVINPIGLMQSLIARMTVKEDININFLILDPLLHNSSFNLKMVNEKLTLGYEHDENGVNCTLNVQDFVKCLLGRIKLPNVPSLLSGLSTAFYEEY